MMRDRSSISTRLKGRGILEGNDEKYDPQTIEAKLEDGVLILTANVKAEHISQYRKLEIKS